MALTQVTSAGLKDGEIVNADLHSSAAIALSKLGTSGTAGSGNFLRGDGAWTAIDLTALNASNLTSGTVAAARLDTATTQSAGNSSTKIATTAFVSTAVTNLIGGAPGALDTLNELAAAINDDSSYASTVTTALGTKAPLASPTFTGTVTTSSLLHISGAEPRLQFTDTNNNPDFTLWTNAGKFTIQDETAGASRLTIDSSGNIGLGNISSPLWTTGGGLHLNDNYFIGFGNGGSGRPDFQIGTTGGATLDFRCGFGSDAADITIGTSGALTVNAKIVTSDWLESSTSGKGLHNSATGMHFFSQGSNETRLLHGSNAQIKLAFRGTGDVLRGAVSADANGMHILTAGSSEQKGVMCITDGETRLYHSGNKRLSTNSNGITIHSTNNEGLVITGSNDPYILFQEGSTNKAWIQWSTGGFLELRNSEAQAGIRLQDDLRFTTDNWSSTNYKIWNEGNDGSGSGLDADTLDGVQGASYLRSDASDTMSGVLTLTSGSDYPVNINGAADPKLILQGSSNPYIRFREGSTNKAFIQWNSGGWLTIYNQEDSSSLRIRDGIDFSPDGTNYYSVWHSNNDGAGSNLDAGKVGGYSINSHNSYNVRLYGNNAAAMGLVGVNNSGSFRWQLYGTGTEYGFLDSIWGGWDIRKTVNGSMYLNGTTNPIISQNDSPTFGEVYATAWFRNNNSGQGLYNTSTTQHFYSDNDDYWNVAGGGSANAIRFRDESGGTIRGYIYANSSSNIGILNSGGQWSILCDSSRHSWFYGNVLPSAGNTWDLGSSSYRWNNLYVNDMHFSNEGKEGGNDVDGTTGDWTLQEGADTIFMINNKTGKKYKMALQEVS